MRHFFTAQGSAWPYVRTMTSRLVAGFASAALAAGACTSGDGAAGSSPTAPLAVPTQSLPSVPGQEVRASSTTMQAWALLYEPSPWKPGQEVKVVWRATGTGDFRVVAIGPQSQEVPPVSGPTKHFGSNWERPGEEWGTFFRLNEPGRWQLRVQRGSSTATLPLEVVA